MNAQPQSGREACLGLVAAGIASPLPHAFPEHRERPGARLLGSESHGHATGRATRRATGCGGARGLDRGQALFQLVQPVRHRQQALPFVPGFEGFQNV